MSTRPAAGADPFLTIKILKCQAFSENPVCRTTGFYQILKIKNSGEKKNEHKDKATRLLAKRHFYTHHLLWL